MSNQRPKIRWRENDLKELQRVINNFNQKLYRAKKRNPESAEFLPARKKKSEVIKEIETRGDFNRALNSMKRFSKKGAEAPVKSSRGAKTTKWELHEFNRNKGIENARRTRERKAIGEKEVKRGGKGTGNKRSEMGTIKENSMKNYGKKFEGMKQDEWEEAKKFIDRSLNAEYRQHKKEIMRKNYLEGLRRNGFLDDAPEIEDYVMGLDIDTFVATVQIDETATFDFYKDPISWYARLDEILNSWRMAYAEDSLSKIDELIKGV